MARAQCVMCGLRGCHKLIADKKLVFKWKGNNAIKRQGTWKRKVRSEVHAALTWSA